MRKQSGSSSCSSSPTPAGGPWCPGEGQGTVRFSLPEGAANLEFQEGALGSRYVETADGFADTVPVRPGSETYQILFAFEMPYDRKLELVQPVTCRSMGWSS